MLIINSFAQFWIHLSLLFLFFDVDMDYELFMQNVTILEAQNIAIEKTKEIV